MPRILVHSSEPGDHKFAEDCWCKPKWRDTPSQSHTIGEPRFVETHSDLWQCTVYRRDWDYEAMVAERDRYRHALANIIARFGVKPLPKNEGEHGAYYEAEQMAMIAEEALGAERS